MPLEKKVTAVELAASRNVVPVDSEGTTSVGTLAAAELNTTQPCSHVDAPEQVSPSVDGQTETPPEISCLMASLRAIFKLNTSEVDWVIARSFCRKLLNAGTALAVRMAATDSVTSTSTSVNPYDRADPPWPGADLIELFLPLGTVWVGTSV
jgi:hypothetical protein